MLVEFKTFAKRGDAVGLAVGVIGGAAVGVIVGSAVGVIVQSLVGDVFMPVIGAVTGGLDFANHVIPPVPKVAASILAEVKKQGAVLAWVNSLTLVINLMIVAWVLFFVVRFMNRLKRKEVTSTPAPTRDEVLLADIRDLSKQRTSP
jgi:large conductance mechanosensitive channel